MNKGTVLAVLVALVALSVSAWAKPEKVDVILKNGKVIAVPAQAAEQMIENGHAVPAVEMHTISLDPEVSTWDPYGYHVTEMTPDIPLQVVDGSSVTFTVTTTLSLDFIRVFVNGEHYTTFVSSGYVGSFTIDNVTEDIEIQFNK